MLKTVSPAKQLRGRLALDGDKSISHRVAIFNAIAAGRARIDNFAPGDDCRATVACLRALGASIAFEGETTLTVNGAGKSGLREPETVLNARESGTTMRLLAGLLAALPFFSVLSGERPLRARPMGRVIQPLRLMGAGIQGRTSDTRAPLAIKGGGLKGIDYTLPVASAQVKSALIIAGLFAGHATVIREPALTRDHTERMLKAMGADLSVDGLSVTVEPLRGELKALDIRIPSDISSAAYWLVAGAIHPDARIELPGTGINPGRAGIIEVLREMGARITVSNTRSEGNEPVADLLVESSELKGVQIGGSLVPRLIDEIPVIALAASAARGDTTIRDAAELRVKESDRIAATVREMRKIGADIEELPDGMVIHGGKKLAGGSCGSHNDHRLAMTLGIGGLVSSGPVAISNAGAVSKSYPRFWDDLALISHE